MGVASHTHPKEGKVMAKQTITFAKETYPNVKGITGVTIDGTTLTVTIDLKQDHGPSKSGKTKVVATTGGSVRLPDGVLLGLNVNRK